MKNALAAILLVLAVLALEHMPVRADGSPAEWSTLIRAVKDNADATKELAREVRELRRACR